MFLLRRWRRYKLFFESILAKTPDDHEHKAQLVNVVKLLREVANQASTAIPPQRRCAQACCDTGRVRLAL